MLEHLQRQVGLGGVFLFARFNQLPGLFLPLGYGFHIREDQFQIDGFNIPGGVHAAVHMDDIFILKAAHHMHHRVAFPNVGKEFVAQAFALAGALHQPGNIHKFHCGGRYLLGVIHALQHLQPPIRHGHDARVGLDGAERIIGRLGPRPRDGVKQRAFAHVGQPHNA